MKLDKIIKDILSSDEAKTEYEEVLSQSGILNNDELQDARNSILKDNFNSSYHIRLLTKYTNLIISQIMNKSNFKLKKTKVEIF